jgi:hypothetical protein
MIPNHRFEIDFCDHPNLPHQAVLTVCGVCEVVIELKNLVRKLNF